MKPGGSLPHSRGHSNPILRQINFLVLIHFYYKIHYNIVLPSSLCLPKVPFLVCLPVKIFNALPLSSILAECPALLNLLDCFPDYIRCTQQTVKSSLWNLLHSSLSSLLGPNIRHKILFSKTLSVHSFLFRNTHTHTQ